MGGGCPGERHKGRRKLRALDTSAVRATACRVQRAASTRGARRPGPAALRGEGWTGADPLEPDQAPRRIPESRVLQEAEPPPLHGADPSCRRLRRGFVRARRATPGCRTELEQILREHGSTLLVEDQRCEGKPLDVAFEGRLTAVQKSAARALLREDIGVLVAPPGVGKTVIGTYLIAARSRSTLVLVHRQPLLDQWIAQLSMFLGL